MRLVGGWYITSEDADIRASPIRHQMAKDVRIIDLALRYVRHRSLVIQAGARVGLWPAVLAKDFERVIAFEPETRNYECAKLNLWDCENIELHHEALGKEAGQRMIEFSKIQSGSHQIVETGGDEPCEVVTIDSLNESPDAIFLDIEGYELFALEGALETIGRCKPLLVIEQNDSRLRYGIDKSQIVGLLKPFGYESVDRCGKDIVYRAA